MLRPVLCVKAIDTSNTVSEERDGVEKVGTSESEGKESSYPANSGAQATSNKVDDAAITGK